MTKTNSVQRVFIIGDEWVYYKIYCGVSVANDILTNIILPFGEENLNQGIISSWFFIRYNDPESHLRIRFKLIDENDIGIIVNGFKKILKTHVRARFIWDVQLYSYKREIERYGVSTISLVEYLFFNDSILTIKTIEQELTDEEHILYVFKIISTILTELQFSTDNKLKLAEYGRNAFKKEFNANKFTVKQLDKKSRQSNNK